MNTTLVTKPELEADQQATPPRDALAACTERMQQQAHEAVRRAEAMGVTLDYEVDSLPHVANIAMKGWKNRKRAWHRSSTGKVKPELVANMLGAYIGEMMVARHSAAWVDDYLLICGSEALDPSELVLNHMRRRTTANLENVVRYFIGQEVGHDYV